MTSSQSDNYPITRRHCRKVIRAAPTAVGLSIAFNETVVAYPSTPYTRCNDRCDHKYINSGPDKLGCMAALSGHLYPDLWGPDTAVDRRCKQPARSTAPACSPEPETPRPRAGLCYSGGAADTRMRASLLDRRAA